MVRAVYLEVRDAAPLLRPDYAVRERPPENIAPTSESELHTIPLALLSQGAETPHLASSFRLCDTQDNLMYLSHIPRGIYLRRAWVSLNPIISVSRLSNSVQGVGHALTCVISIETSVSLQSAAAWHINASTFKLACDDAPFASTRQAWRYARRHIS